MFRDDFKGTGSMKGFCEESNKLFSALNNVEFQMPPGYSGAEPTVKVYEDRIVFDFGEALIFTINNIEWNLTGTATYNSYSANVFNGKLYINVDAD